MFDPLFATSMLLADFATNYAVGAALLGAFLVLLSTSNGVVGPRPDWNPPARAVPPATRRDYLNVALMFAAAVAAVLFGLHMWNR